MSKINNKMIKITVKVEKWESRTKLRWWNNKLKNNKNIWYAPYNNNLKNNQKSIKSLKFSYAEITKIEIKIFQRL